MTRYAVLLVIVSLQVVFILLTLGLLLVTRLRGSRSRARTVDAGAALRDSLHKIMLGDDRGESLASALLGLRPEIAARELMDIGGTKLSPEQRRGLATLIRHSPWVEHVLAQASSRRWWKRLEVARLLVMVCDETDAPLVARLVTDRHAAVASAATAAISGCATPEVVDAIVTGLPLRPPAVRLQQCTALRGHAALATHAVVARLSRPATSTELKAWIQLAEVLATPDALAAVVFHASDPDGDIRISVARALRNSFSLESAAAVTLMLRDVDWRVRAAAARAVGSLNARDAIPMLSDSMHDESWWVRFRAGLALADLSQEGRTALDAAKNSPDPFARDMATLICGLSDGGRLDLTAG